MNIVDKYRLKKFDYYKKKVLYGTADFFGMDDFIPKKAMKYLLNDIEVRKKIFNIDVNGCVLLNATIGYIDIAGEGLTLDICKADNTSTIKFALDRGMLMNIGELYGIDKNMVAVCMYDGYGNYILFHDFKDK